ncbi:hypothetical protein BSY18_4089 (plasmid) [Blastomonas sp. RAC04]|nr:hypothetical protein BSY18_4089 [Blastomonas sp. RAC04]
MADVRRFNVPVRFKSINACAVCRTISGLCSAPAWITAPTSNFEKMRLTNSELATDPTTCACVHPLQHRYRLPDTLQLAMPVREICLTSLMTLSVKHA